MCIRDRYEAVTSVSNEQDIIVKAAAVADYRPSKISEEKVKKSDGQMSIELERTDDILKFLGEHKRHGQFLCGFSMETQNVIDNSRAKLAKKMCIRDRKHAVLYTGRDSQSQNSSDHFSIRTDLSVISDYNRLSVHTKLPEYHYLSLIHICCTSGRKESWILQ